jgi:chorismate dehydratase
VPALRKLRVSAISFLNTAPLMWDFTHAPRQAGLAEKYDVHFTLPNRCAAELAAGNADIGLVPVAALAGNSDLAVVPGIAIASLGFVRSILLVTRKGLALEDVQSVALDTTSRTSAALVHVIFSRFIGTNPLYTQHAPDVETMLQGADAALLIGDPALLAREANLCGEYECYDLAEFWKQRTGLPFVFAVWAVRNQAIRESTTSAEHLIRDFSHSRDAGLANLEALAEEWTSRMALPAATIHEYWSKNIHYSLDEPCLNGLQLFYKYGAECGALLASHALTFLRWR